jgi:hypothetical protein
VEFVRDLANLPPLNSSIVWQPQQAKATAPGITQQSSASQINCPALPKKNCLASLQPWQPFLVIPWFGNPSKLRSPPLVHTTKSEATKGELPRKTNKPTTTEASFAFKQLDNSSKLKSSPCRHTPKDAATAPTARHS